jgi:hypothetical protein
LNSLKFYNPSFLKKAGATIEGVKPSELVKIDEIEYQSIYPKYFTNNEKVKIISVRKCGSKRQVFVYHVECLRNVLEKKEVRDFLVKLGYPKSADFERLISHLIKRLRSFLFPHEIGVFLGYPLKDVQGYMGLNSLKHTKTMGWRMYGNTSGSEKLRLLYCDARERATEKFASELLG